ncbi:hypothetical protein BDQ17DRAFT_1431163 [Cyathus striatus]|nr:hypothetical protein BDQ17DRAFT_1431163 [Cyathus striatus]
MSSSNDAVETSALASVACNAILYGAHLVVFPICMYLLIQRRRKGVHVHWFLIPAVLAQFFLSTAYIAIQLFMTFQSFIRLQPYPPSPPSALLSLRIHASEVRSLPGWSSSSEPRSPIALYWLDTHAKIQIASSLVCFLNTLIGDTILIWRLHVVWGSKWFICIPPILPLTASGICAFVIASIEASSIYNIVNSLAIATWSLSIGTQVIATLLIAYKIYQGGRLSEKVGVSWRDGPYKKVLWIVLESGAVYSALALSLMVLFAVGKLAAAVVLMACLAQTAAIIPATIVILVHLDLTPPSRPTGHSTMSHGTGIAFASLERQSTTSEDEIEVGSSPSKGINLYKDPQDV